MITMESRGGSIYMGFLSCSPGPRGYKGPPWKTMEIRTTMSNNRLNYLSVLSINCDLTKDLQCDEQIKEFAAQKCRNVAL